MPDIFLSYSREDQATARLFAEGLEREGFSVWWDQALTAGESFDEVTEQALTAAKAVVVLWSPRSTSSRWVRAEAAEADENRTLVPVLIEPCTVPIKFKLTQTADLAGWTGDGADARWQSFSAGLKRFVCDSAKGSSAASAASAAPSISRISHRNRWIGGAAVVVAALFCAWLWQQNHGSGSSGSPANNRTRPTDVSIAVLPFVNMSSDPQQDYFSDGLAEELLNQLAQIPGLRVIGRTSSFVFKGRTGDLRQIGQTLGANHLLEGSVRKAGDRIKITAQLINAADGSHLWSEAYERKLDDVFAIQDEIAHTVAEQLQFKLGVQDLNTGGTKNVAAYDEFLNGRELLNSNDDVSLVAAVPHLERALALDPDYMSARLWLIDAYLRAALGNPEPRSEIIRKQEQAIDEVVRRAPDSPEASFALSYRAGRGRDLVQMERLLRDAATIPESTGTRARLRYGQFLMGVGDTRAALRELEAVRRNDPLDAFSHTQTILALEVAGELAQAERDTEDFLNKPGGNAQAVYGTLITLAMDQRDETKLRRAVQLGVAAHAISAEQAVQTERMLKEPAAELRNLRKEVASTGYRGDVFLASGIATRAAFLHDNVLSQQAMRALFSQNFSFETIAFSIWRPVMREVRADPAFRKLLHDVGLVDYWRKTGNWGEFCKPISTDDFECR
jgi:TolB-like protein